MTKSRTSETGTSLAQQPLHAYGPKQYRIERHGVQNEPLAGVMPNVTGGVCEFCGIIDPNVPSQFQYKFCQHYRSLDLQCSYCENNKNPDDVNYHSGLIIKEFPIESGNLIICCNSLECAKLHRERFQINK